MLKKIIIILIALILIAAVGFGIYKFVVKPDSQAENQVTADVNQNQNSNANTNTNKNLNTNIFNARIDISNTGDKENGIDLLDKKPSDMYEVIYDNPEWNKIPGTFKTYLFIAKPQWQKGEIKIKAKGEGNLNVSFLGHYRPDEKGKAKKILIDYRNVSINDEPVFTDAKTLWHDERERKIVQALDGEVYTIKFEYRTPEEKK